MPAVAEPEGTLTASTDHTLLVRMDERLKNIERALGEGESGGEPKFVTRDEFAPIKAVVYSGVGLILAAVCGAIIALAINGKKLHADPTTLPDPASVVVSP